MTFRRILGIDPGSRFMGYGIVEEVSGKVKPVAYNVLSIEKEISFPKKMKCIFDTVTKLIEDYKPHEMALETLFFAKNVSSAIKLGQARGAIITAAATQSLNIYEYSPTQIKQSIVGYGRSSKEQIQKMIGLLLSIDFNKTNIEYDASDALAVAVCHLHSNRLNEKLKRIEKQR